MSDEFETAKEIATHPVSLTSLGIVFAWLVNKLWRGHRHEVDNMKQSITTQGEYLGKLYEKLEQHAQRNSDLFRELTGKIGDNHAEVMRVLGGKADR